LFCQAIYHLQDFVVKEEADIQHQIKPSCDATFTSCYAKVVHLKAGKNQATEGEFQK